MGTPAVCKHLRNKKMYVPGQDAAVFSDEFDPNSFAHWWCNRTMTEIGEDDDLVSLRGCSSACRSCFKAP